MQDLHTFLAHLEEAGHLHRVAVETDPVLEIAAITDRVCKLPEGGTALLFERVRGSRFPLATNLFGSNRRVCAALGVNDLAELAGRMEELLAAAPADDLLGLTASSPVLAPFAPRETAEAPCREVAEPVPDLERFPFLKVWSGDGAPGRSGRFLTLPLVITRDPEGGRPNCGLYRVEVLDGHTAALHWRPGSGAAGHARQWAARGAPMPVAIALGGDPAALFAALLPLPAGLDELQLAGWLRREPLAVSRCRTSDLQVPATADLVIEGFVAPGESVEAGAFGNHTGFYALAGKVPLLRVTAISRRSVPIIPATVVGRPPMEDCWLARAAGRFLLPLIRRVVPGVVDLHLPFAGIFHGCALVAVAKSRPGQGREVLAGLWQGGWLGEGRLLVIVDRDVDLHNADDLPWRVLNRVRWERDLVFGPVEDGGLVGGRLGVDATRKLPEELAGAAWPGEVRPDEATVRLVAQRWREYGLSEE